MSGANDVQLEFVTLSVRPTSWWRHWPILRHLPFFVGSRPRFSVTMTVPDVQAVEQSTAARGQNPMSVWSQVQWGIQKSSEERAYTSGEYLFGFRHEATGDDRGTAVSVGVRSGTPAEAVLTVDTTSEGTEVWRGRPSRGIAEPYAQEEVGWQPLVGQRRYETIVRIPILEKSGETIFEIAGEAGYVFETYTREGLFVKAILPAIAFAGAMLLGYLNLADRRMWWPFEQAVTQGLSP